MINDVLAETEERMKKAIEALRYDLTSIRTGRATPSLVDRVMVEYYGTPTPLQQLATITVPEAQMISIRPYSASDIPAIEKAIAKSDLNLNPNNDGQQIRIIIPSLNEERRRELNKLVSKRGEEARVAVRNVRRDAISDLREFEKESMISEDDSRRGQERVQEKTDAYIKQVDEVVREKEAEIMTV
ncbi:MAG: ribosome recycling factor [Caldilineaceae bacterium]|nr:ribosome recycling factor [Caldilineaceae bacterium]MCB0127288.1 ribosome recycling factor [Caldilineaceae bacterium]HRW07696.1 ribosome recycling factor [Caldilineaceae bacterium]